MRNYFRDLWIIYFIILLTGIGRVTTNNILQYIFMFIFCIYMVLEMDRLFTPTLKAIK